MDRTYREALSDFFYGSPEQHAAASVAQSQAYESEKRSAEEMYGVPWYRLPPEIKSSVSVDALTQPYVHSPYNRAVLEAVRYPMEIGSRPRDSVLAGLNAIEDGDTARGIGLMAGAVPSIAAPIFGGGREGDDDDWRPRAIADGVSPAAVMRFDMLADPANFIPLSAYSKLGMALPRAARMRRAAGISTSLVDRYGNKIRDLMPAQRVSSSGRLGLPSP